MKISIKHLNQIVNNIVENIPVADTIKNGKIDTYKFLTLLRDEIDNYLQKKELEEK